MEKLTSQESKMNSKKNSDELNPFAKTLLEHWGREDSFGPWTKNDPSTENEKELKFYRHYFLVSTNETPDIECLVDEN